ncbi:MAG: radical SAM protein, partial [Armatimonadota bacterium]
MVNVTKLYCGISTPGDYIRYRKRLKGKELSLSSIKPVVVWNLTKRCNLSCIHCYYDSKDVHIENELTTKQAEKVIDDLASFKVPHILFSGGEPLTRSDLFHLASYAGSKGLKYVLSTNGTLISKSTAQNIKKTGFSY